MCVYSFRSFPDYAPFFTSENPGNFGEGFGHWKRRSQFLGNYVETSAHFRTVLY